MNVAKKNCTNPKAGAILYSLTNELYAVKQAY